MKITKTDLVDLKQAKEILENPGLTAKITNLIGTPFEKSMTSLPQKWQEKIGAITKKTLSTTLSTALLTMNDDPGKNSSNIMHKLAVTATGAIGGLGGLPALAIELPLSTAIIMRSIADIARGEGESLNDSDAKIACLEVFALGGPSDDDDAVDAGYFAVRSALAKTVTEATMFIAKQGAVKESAPVLVRLIIQVAERFSVQVSTKAVAQAIPVAGAIGGGVVNNIFMNHFQDMARGHFTVRRLERKYGEKAVREQYALI